MNTVDRGRGEEVGKVGRRSRRADDSHVHESVMVSGRAFT